MTTMARTSRSGVTPSRKMEARSALDGEWLIILLDEKEHNT